MLRFQGPKHLASWLRSPRGRRIRDQCVSDVESAWVKAEPKLPEASSFALQPRVLIVTEGICVKVYVDGEVKVKHVDCPVCRTPAGMDRADEIMASRLRWWSGLKHRMTFWTDTRLLRERVFDEVLLKLVRESDQACTRL